jgi:8-oxo-dGTP pyrophosphatase MutT (NUDIX family)
VCVHADHLLCVQLRDPQTRIARLFVPGGAIDAGETPEQAAQRETLEETGYRVLVDPTQTRVAHYPFVWDGTARRVTTHFFRASLLEPERAPQPVQDAPYNEGMRWLNLDEVPQALSFQADILGAVSSLLAPR